MDIHNFFVGWQARQIGSLAYDGHAWTFDYEAGWLLPMSLTKNPRPRSIPGSLLAMMPEGFRHDAMFANADGNLLETLQRSERFMSNIVIVDDPAKIGKIPLDRLHGRLQEFATEGTFHGRLERVPRIVGPFVAQLRELVSRRTLPLMSGFHAKIPMFLDSQGNMSPAEYTPFTHILKLPGLHGDKDYSRSVIEWTCMEISRAGGLKTAECALVALADDKIGMVSERFDVCRDEDDMRLLFAEEFFAFMGKGVASHVKYKGTTEEIATKLRDVSTNFDADSREFLRLVAANLLVENGDFHLKNMSMLKIAEPTLDGYRHVRLAPAYDIMNTRPFVTHPQPSDARVIEPVVFPINGKDEDVNASDLLALAEFMNIPSDEATEILNDLAAGMMVRARELHESPPELVANQESTAAMLRWTCERLSQRIADIFPSIDTALGNDRPSMGRLSRP